MPDLKHCLAIARLIMTDSMRRHALKGLLLFAMLAECSGMFFFSFIPRDIGRASADFILSLGWITGMIFLFFHCVNVLAWSEERRVIYTLLARPISREEYVAGVFSGLAGVLVLLNTILASIGYGILVFIKNTELAAAYFLHLSPIAYILSWGGVFFGELMILAVLTLFSGLVRGSFPVLLMGIAYYGIANGLPVVRTATAQLVKAQLMNDAVPNILIFLSLFFQTFETLDFKDAIAIKGSIPLSLSTLLPFGVALAYTIFVLLAACYIYRERDII